jgi:DNA-binding NarL/FixJ family response regulator
VSISRPELEENMARTRVLLADHHREMRDKVVQHLGREFQVVGAVRNGRDLLKAVSEKSPDVCVLDITMPVLTGIETAKKLKAGASGAKIVFLSVEEDPDFLAAALDIGASAYVLKSRIVSDLIPAIKAAVAGHLFISPFSSVQSAVD